MSNRIAFHETARGHLHIKRELPCEDWSASFSEENGRYHMAVTADGHGSMACPRSGTGARMVTDIAVRCLKEFAEIRLAEEAESGHLDRMRRSETEEGEAITESVENLAKNIYENDEEMQDRHPAFCTDLQNPEQGTLAVKQLTDLILSEWHRGVKNDILQNPVSEEELQQAGSFEQFYRNGERLEHMYGTTLIAALWMKEYLILIQQGDGRCDVFYEDGTVSQPIPWDSRCYANVTTSICDSDAPISIRHCILDLKKTPVIACWLGSDGVEDSYRTMEGTHCFYRALSCELAERGPEEFQEYLKALLPGFSRSGSGDDVSVAGIADLDRLGFHVSGFREQIRIHELWEALQRYENKQNSMYRKHSILKQRMNDGLARVEKCKKDLSAAEKALAVKKAEFLECRRRIMKCRWEMEDNSRWMESVREKMQKESSLLRPSGLMEAFWKTCYNLQEKRIRYCRLSKKEARIEHQIEEYRAQVQSAETAVRSAKEAFRQAKTEFENYNKSYQQIGERCEQIRDRLEEVRKRSEESYDTWGRAEEKAVCDRDWASEESAQRDRSRENQQI